MCGSRSLASPVFVLKNMGSVNAWFHSRHLFNLPCYDKVPLKSGFKRNLHSYLVTPLELDDGHSSVSSALRPTS
ncbi:Plasma Membrane Calcium-Transporting Atpase 1 [Manis pentadactyla]|nr:Plasma Membrane Calcium-Transporting Atpase 1 [Manis pentadactyla]